MELVVTFPVHDGQGNSLVTLRLGPESALDERDDTAPLAFALIVVTVGRRALMVFDRYRGQWELPGGMLDPGETARQAAARELAEETGIATAELDFAAVAECTLQRPVRRDYGAIYRCFLPSEPPLVVNEEIAAFRWWDPRSPLIENMCPIDAEIARRTGGV